MTAVRIEQNKGTLSGSFWSISYSATDMLVHFICIRKLQYMLCKMLGHYGILQQQQLAWFRSSLSRRKQFSRVNGVDLSVEEIYFGIPQGSCLGPLLFLIYINDLSRAIRKVSVSMYADDISLCHQSSEIAQLSETINTDLAQVEQWLAGKKILT